MSGDLGRAGHSVGGPRTAAHSNPTGLVFEAHRLVYHSTLGLRVIKKKRRRPDVGVRAGVDEHLIWGLGFRVYDLGFGVKGLGFRASI